MVGAPLTMDPDSDLEGASEEGVDLAPEVLVGVSVPGWVGAEAFAAVSTLPGAGNRKDCQHLRWRPMSIDSYITFGKGV